MVGVNESGTYYFRNINLDVNKIKNSIIKNNVNNCLLKSNFDELIQDFQAFCKSKSQNSFGEDEAK